MATVVNSINCTSKTLNNELIPTLKTVTSNKIAHVHKAYLLSWWPNPNSKSLNDRVEAEVDHF